ncbi:MAG: nucleoside hydrolase [Armatimonadota bacterium]
MHPIPVILDTDIGGDIDDTWALAFLLRSPELDLKLVTTATGDTIYRAKIVAKMLEIAGRVDIPVGIGLRDLKCERSRYQPQAPWVEGYDLTRYPGTVADDGVDTLVRAIMDAPEPVTVIAIGPLTNMAAALRREPRIAQRARFVGMHGCLRRSHDGSPEVIAEYNVACDVPACQQVFTAGWEVTITPLDTCGIVRLQGENYRAVCASPDPLTRAVLENYRIWLHGEPYTRSSILFDTVAVYLAYAEDLLDVQPLGIRVDDTGYTRRDDTAKIIRCAVDWKNLPAFEDILVGRLC